MKKALFCLVLPLLLCLLVACGESGSTPTTPPEQTPAAPDGTVAISFVLGDVKMISYVPEGETPVFEGSTIRPSSDTTTYRFIGWDKAFAPATESETYTALYEELPLVTYEVRWILEDGDYTTTVRENAIPTPPEGYSKVTKTAQFIRTFREWNATFEPLTKEYAEAHPMIVYTALYDDERRPYEVTFTLDGKEFAKTTTYYNELPTLPEATPPKKSGYTGVAWLGSTKAVTEDGVTLTGIYTVSEPKLVAWSYDRPLLSFSSNLSDNDNRGGVGEEASAILYMTLEIRSTPDSSYRDTLIQKVAASLAYMMSEDGYTPNFDLEPYWCYSMLTGAVTLCRETPLIWDRLTALEKEKYDFLMKVFAYTVNYGYADSNNYKTGPGFRGNFHKSWNPNYRLALVPVMLYACRYFGSADALDEILLAFDYDATVAKFEEYGWSRPYSNWRKTPPTANGVKAPSQKETMENGGSTFFLESGNKKDGGSGKGVRVAFKYGGKRADDVAGVFNQLLTYNYSGGAVVSEYICTNGGTASIRAYIIDGTRSPYEGRLGMMHEIAKDNRASAKYALDDFTLVVSNLAVFEELDMYDLDVDAGASLASMVWVGNMDFLYKIGHGWMSYAQSSGTSQSTFEQSTLGYYLWKDFWLGHYESEPGSGAVTPEPKPEPKPEPEGALSILDLDFTESAVDVTDASVTVGALKLRVGSSAKAGVSFRTVSDASGNEYLRMQEVGGGGGFDANVTRTGGLTDLGGRHLLTVSLKLAKPSDASQSTESTLRLRATGSSDGFKLLTTAKNGTVSAFGTALTTLTDSFQTVTMTLDLESGLYAVTVDGVEKLRVTLTVAEHHTKPSTTSAATFADWVKTTAANGYVFNWYHAAGSSSKTNALAIDDFQITFS